MNNDNEKLGVFLGISVLLLTIIAIPFILLTAILFVPLMLFLISVWTLDCFADFVFETFRKMLRALFFWKN